MTSTKSQFPTAVAVVGVAVRTSVCLVEDTICPTALLLVKTSKNCGEVFSLQALNRFFFKVYFMHEHWTGSGTCVKTGAECRSLLCEVS